LNRYSEQPTPACGKVICGRNCASFPRKRESSLFGDTMPHEGKDYSMNGDRLESSLFGDTMPHGVPE
jgi:hypothetical protein